MKHFHTFSYQILVLAVIFATVSALENSNSYKRYLLTQESLKTSGSDFNTCTTNDFYWKFKDDKYVVDEHRVTTKDGYILQMFRVRLSESEKAKLQQTEKNTDVPVLLVHGMCDSSDGWFLARENNSIGFYFVNKGYDVWFGNNRGNKYSQRSTNHYMFQKNFYAYSYDEMGLYDTPAFYEKVITETKKDKLLYMGHSEGNTQFWVAGLDETTRTYIEDHT